MTTRGHFPKPSEIKTPEGAEGWENLYTYSFLFSEDRRETEEKAFWFQDGMHWREVLYPFDATLAEFNPGAGPRHFAFLPRERAGYSLNEIQSTITTLSYDRRRGQLSALQTVSTLPPDFTGGNGTAEIFVHPSGKFVYASNRGHDSLAVFKVTDSQGRLSPVQHMPIGGRTPRGFGIDPTGRWILVGNQSSDQVTVFRIDSRTGKLTAAGAPVPVGSPVSVHFLKMK